MKNNKIQEAEWQEMRAKRFKLTDTESLCDWSEEFDRVYLKAYNCGYMSAVKEIVKKNIIPDSTATIIYKNGYDEGYAACVREIEKKLSKDNTIAFESWKQGYTEGCTEFARLMKEKTDDLYHKLEEREVWGISGDVVCNNCENLVAKLIDTLLKEMTEKKEVTKNDNKHKIIS